MVQRFLKKLILFSIPMLLILLLPIYIYWVSGELNTIDQIVNEQMNSSVPTITGFAYLNGAGYKFKSILRRKPEVLVLGTSRVMQFRSDFFKNPRSFYNGGGMTVFLEHFKKALDAFSA